MSLTNILLTTAASAFICGVAVFYLVMQRTRRKREAEKLTDS